MGRFSKVNNKCVVCGKPCRVKYCAECRKEHFKQYHKEYMKSYASGKSQKRYQGCNEDCANCPYPDCYKPVHQMKPTRETATVREKENPTSQQKIYTLCLGGYGGARPNSSKKFMY